MEGKKMKEWLFLQNFSPIGLKPFQTHHLRMATHSLDSNEILFLTNRIYAGV